MFFLSSTCSSHERILEAIKELTGYGVCNIELSGNLTFYGEWRQDLEMLKQRFELNLLIHNYFPPPEGTPFVLNLASNDSDIKQRSFEVIQNAVDLMDEMQIPLYSIHAGRRAYVYPATNSSRFIFDEEKVEDRAKSTRVFYENIDFVMWNFFHNKHHLAVENIFPDYGLDRNYSLITAPLEITGFLEYSKQYPNLGLLLDLGHLNVSSKMSGFDIKSFTYEILSRYPDKIFELHLSENDGNWDNHEITQEDSWQIELLRQYPEIIRRVPVVFEWNNKGNIEEFCERFHQIDAIFAAEVS
ncbi:MAG: TIM barrel protein [Planctomycetota bacterium]|jgi:sugar phosphate isomerase/epimerase